ncbi:MAG: hypothetical protein ACOYOF_19460, partial [Verrucomicrobiaceae bacterium]
MKSLITILATAALASSVFAGPVSSGKNAKAPVAPAPAPGCDAFGPGLNFDVFAGAFIPDSGDSELGGGVGVGYFFNRFVGLDLNYGVYATESEHHQFDGNLVLRAPIDSLCIAPYALVGGGFSTNGSTDGLYQVGGGLDVRLQSLSNLGVFAEGL